MRHSLSKYPCPGCLEKFQLYPGFHEGLKAWFFTEIQSYNPDAHISEAGRGEKIQEGYVARGKSRAHFGESAHNYNAAMDIFRLKDGQAMYPLIWFQTVVESKLKSWLVWYGAPGSEFYELPHVELKGWRELVKKGELKLVEQPSMKS